MRGAARAARRRRRRAAAPRCARRPRRRSASAAPGSASRARSATRCSRRCRRRTARTSELAERARRALVAARSTAKARRRPLADEVEALCAARRARAAAPPPPVRPARQALPRADLEPDRPRRGRQLGQGPVRGDARQDRGRPDARAACARSSDMLHHARKRHAEVRGEREKARDALKALIDADARRARRARLEDRQLPRERRPLRRR